ncbi:MAG: ABC transporter permease [Candidatus Actinomarinales bacterium]|nr:MAG: ABC transporter permease [Candidatus Actinomarinales bacterium]
MESIKQRLKLIDSWTLIGLVATLFVAIIFFSTQSEYFFTTRNFLNISRAISIRGILAVSVTMLLISGSLDLSLAAVAAAASMATASLMNSGYTDVQAFIGGIITGGLLGATNGLIVVKFRIPPIIATLGTLLTFRGLGYVFSGGDSIVIGAQTWAYLGRGTSIFNLPVSFIVFMSVLIFFWAVLNFSVVGNYIYSIGSDPDPCRYVGINVDRIRFSLFVFSAIIAAFAGLILLSQGGTAQPRALQGAELDIIAAVLLGGVNLRGGKGSLVGTFLGMCIIGVINNGTILLNVPAYWQMVFRGTILIIAVTLDSFRKGGGYR